MYYKYCKICGNSEDLKNLKGINICPNCDNKLKYSILNKTNKNIQAKNNFVLSGIKNKINPNLLFLIIIIGIVAILTAVMYSLWQIPNALETGEIRISAARGVTPVVATGNMLYVGIASNMSFVIGLLLFFCGIIVSVVKNKKSKYIKPLTYSGSVLIILAIILNFMAYWVTKYA